MAVSGHACSRSTKEWSTVTTKYRNVEHKGQISVFANCLPRDFIVDGENPISCENGLLTGDLPVCKKVTNACAPLDPPLFGSKLCTVKAPAVGSVCTFYCTSTHHLRGSQRRICTESLQWTGNEVHCEERPKCLTPLPLENGKVIGCSPSRILLFNDTCHFQCNEGFQLEGPDHLTCGLSGKMVDDHGVERFPKCYTNSSQEAPQRENLKALDPCTINRGGCDHFCNLVADIPTCSCNKGFLLQRDGKTCRVKNVAETEEMKQTRTKKEYCNGQCGPHKCVQELTGVRCSCRRGYKLLPDNKTCEDINECSSKNFRCSHQCINTFGAAHCACPKGYTLLKNNRKQCVDINECLHRNNFGCSHKCINTAGGAQCGCPAGYKLHTRNKKLCIDFNECSDENFGCSHQCINTFGGAHCACLKGYRLHENKKQCMDVDECADEQLNRCDHDCFNTEGGYNCSCRPGHVALGEFRCEPCRMNSYKSMDDEACIDCPLHSHTEGVGKTSWKECICNSGFSGNLVDSIPCQALKESDDGFNELPQNCKTS
ncbi:signal peptide, CUB and EGF-like domain-containing protein 2 [Trichonephila clavipes]|nr:signal peptide, CUB and EGF-like domain-containing protein 2 [Trichonephila clavipes]